MQNKLVSYKESTYCDLNGPVMTSSFEILYLCLYAFSFRRRRSSSVLFALFFFWPTLCWQVGRQPQTLCWLQLRAASSVSSTREAESRRRSASLNPKVLNGALRCGEPASRYAPLVTSQNYYWGPAAPLLDFWRSGTAAHSAAESQYNHVRLIPMFSKKLEFLLVNNNIIFRSHFGSICSKLLLQLFPAKFIPLLCAAILQHVPMKLDPIFSKWFPLKLVPILQHVPSKLYP